ncbi:MAG: TonB-dependent receptor [Bacteroidetes bacterium]|nr:TonB-dependent receptor [Bacteroidota bacterium]
MKKITLLFSILISTLGFSQALKPDTLFMGPGYINDVYYNVFNQQKTTSLNTDWHLAFMTSNRNASIRINSGRGVRLFRVPNAAIGDFSSFDTTGWKNFTELHDLNSKWDRDAFTSIAPGPSSPFDYGWGDYNQTSHDVVGDSLYIIVLPGGLVKKLSIDTLFYDSLYTFRYADLDNSNMKTGTFNKRAYPNKLFGYYSLITDQIIDREPVDNTWQLRFTRYNELIPTGPSTADWYPVVGALSNLGTEVVKATGVDVAAPFNPSLTFTNNTNAIGSDWKTFDQSTNKYVIPDSTVYFVRMNRKNTADSMVIAKVVFVLIVSMFLWQITVAQVKSATVISILNEKLEPISETNVLISTDNKKFNIYISDFAGKIKLNTALPLFIKINRLGYEPFEGSFNENQITIKLVEVKTELNGYVITGQTEAKKTENAPQKIIVIDSKKIQQLGAVSLKDVLLNELNFRQNNDQFLGASTSIRGISGQNIKILIDGVPINGRENGNIDLSQLVLTNIERIEIIEGPMAVNFGSDALAGVINLITKKNASKKLNGQINTLYESIGRYNVDGRLGFSYKKISYSVSGGRYFFGGWDTLTESRQKLWKPKTQYFIENQLSVKVGKSSFIRLQLNYYNELLSAKGPLSISPYEAYSIDQYFKTTRINSIVNFEKKFKNNHQLNIIASAQHYQRLKNTFYKDHVTLTQSLTPADDEQDTNIFITYMSRGIYNAAVENKKYQWQLGYEVNHDIALGDKLKTESQKITEVAGFGNIELKPNAKWLLRLGARSVWNSKFGTPLVPAVNIKYTPTTTFTIRLSYAKGYRTPSLKELYLYFVDQNHRVLGNDQLGKESSNNLNLDLEKKLNTKAIHTTLNGSLYYNHINNMISLIATNLLINEYTYKNINQYTNLGSTVSIGVKYKDLSVKSGFGIMSIQSQFQNNSFSNLTHEINTQLTYKIAKIKTDISIFYKYNGKISNYILADDGNSVSVYTIYGYHWMDLSANKSFLKNHMMVTLGAKNLLNVKNVNTSGNSGGIHTGSSNFASMGYGRTLFASIKYYL